MSRYAIDDSGPFNVRARSSQPPLRCEGCGQTVTAYNSAAWNAGLCDRCQPANDNPELARLERMNKAASEPLAVECVWCVPPHIVTPGRFPATSGLCDTALATQLHELDEAERRQKGTAA